MAELLADVPQSRLVTLLDAMRTVRIGVVGDLMLDRYLVGDVARVSPEAPVPIIAIAAERESAGGAANVAANLVALGAAVTLVGIYGDDAAGESLLACVTALAINPSRMVAVPGRPTTTKTRVVARGQQVARLDHEVTTSLDPAHAEAVRRGVEATIAEVDVLLVADYDKGVCDPALARLITSTARAAAVPVVVDPKQRQFFDYAGATVLKPNRCELAAALTTAVSGDSHQLEAARQRTGANHLLLTLGAEGMILVSPDAPLRHAHSIAREVFDVSGAGDTVTAWLGAALAAGASIEEAAWIANLAAGVGVAKSGAAVVTGEEVVALGGGS